MAAATRWRSRGGGAAAAAGRCVVGAGGGYAAEVLREMYGGSLPRAAVQLLKEHAQTRSSSAPAGLATAGGSSPSSGPAPAWSTGLAERGSEKRRPEVRVPKVGQKKAQDAGGLEPGGGLPPRPPPARKTQAQILVETGNYHRQDDRAALPKGVDRVEETRRYQDRCAFNFGSALPTLAPPSASASSAAPPADAAAGPRPAGLRRRVTFAGMPDSLSGTARGTSGPPHGKATGSSGLTAEQERMAEEIVQAVREKQRDLESVEEAMDGLTCRAVAPGEGADRRRLLHKQMAGASQRRLELRSAISRDVQDLEKLLDLAPSAAAT